MSRCSRPSPGSITSNEPLLSLASPACSMIGAPSGTPHMANNPLAFAVASTFGTSRRMLPFSMTTSTHCTLTIPLGRGIELSAPRT